MAEWAKARDSKSCIPKGIGGSNPSLSVSAFGWIDYDDTKTDYGDERPIANGILPAVDGSFFANG